MLFRFVLSVAIGTFIAFASSTSVEAQERPIKPTPQPLIIVINETIPVSDVFQSSPPVLMDESIGVLDTTTSSNVIVNEHVSIDDQMDSNSSTMEESLSLDDSVHVVIKRKPNGGTNEAEKSSRSSDCLSNSGGRSSFGSIGLLIAPLALYVWRRMRKF